MLIIENWDDVAPVIKAVWQEVDNVAQEMGGWETVIEGVGLVMAGSFTVRTIGALQQSVLLAGRLSGLLGKIGRMGAMTLTIGVAVSLFKELKDLEQGQRMRVWMLAHSLYRSCKRRSVNAGITVLFPDSKSFLVWTPRFRRGVINLMCH